MDKIDLFIKSGGTAEVEHCQLPGNTTIAELRNLLNEDEDVVFFDEDADEPLDHEDQIGRAGHHNRFLHRNRCKRVAVTVNYSGSQAGDQFGPGTTLARIQKWAERELNIGENDGVELGLLISGTDQKPDASTHIGSLVSCPDCSVEFDLVPTDRINGVL